MKQFAQTLRESATLKMVTLGLAVLLPKFFISGVSISWGGAEVFTSVAMGAGEFGIAFAALVAVWRQREWQKAKEVQ